MSSLLTHVEQEEATKTGLPLTFSYRHVAIVVVVSALEFLLSVFGPWRIVDPLTDLSLPIGTNWGLRMGGHIMLAMMQMSA